MYKLLMLLLSIITVNATALNECLSFKQWKENPSFEITSNFTIESVLTLDLNTPDETDPYKGFVKRKRIPLTGTFRRVNHAMIAEVFLFDESNIELMASYLEMFKEVINVKPLYFIQMFDCLLDLSNGNRLVIFREAPKKNLATHLRYIKSELKTNAKFDVVNVARFFSFMAREVFFLHGDQNQHLAICPSSFYIEETKKIYDS